MRLQLLLLLAASLCIAVGSGGGSQKTFAMEQDFSCPGNTLTITAVDPSGPVSGATIEINKYGSSTVLFSAQSGPDGKAVFTISEDGAYNVKGTREGYSNAYLLSSIKACKAEPAETVYCTEGATLKERVSCVMDLPDDDVLNVRFVPEECRVLGEAEKQKCIETYRILQTCRIGFEGDDGDREACIKPKLGLGENIWDDARACQGGQECLERLRENVYTLAKFRMYNLEYKVKEMMGAGLSRPKAADFIAYIEEAKARFNGASSMEAKKAIIIEVQEEWYDFVGQARAEMGVDG